MVVVKRQRTYKISSDAGGYRLHHGYDEGHMARQSTAWSKEKMMLAG